MTKSLGRKAMEKYGELCWSPQWRDLPPEIKNHWENVAMTIIKENHCECISICESNLDALKFNHALEVD